MILFSYKKQYFTVILISKRKKFICVIYIRQLQITSEISTDSIKTFFFRHCLFISHKCVSTFVRKQEKKKRLLIVTEWASNRKKKKSMNITLKANKSEKKKKRIIFIDEIVSTDC